MERKPTIALLIASTRVNRFADKPGSWLLARMHQRRDFHPVLLDLRSFDLPFFTEDASNMVMETKDPLVRKWQLALEPVDGFVFLVGEYNRSMPGALKNALDQAYFGWVKKPFAVFGYGAVGAARSIAHLHDSSIELQMHPCKSGVHISGSDFFRVHPVGQDAEMAEIEPAIAKATEAMLDDLVWWTKALMVARAQDEETTGVAAS